MNSACLRTVPALGVEVSSYNCSDAIALNTVLPLRFISGRDCCIFARVICSLVIHKVSDATWRPGAICRSSPFLVELATIEQVFQPRYCGFVSILLDFDAHTE